MKTKGYKKQGKAPTCGPYALYNALIWAGNKRTLKYCKGLLKYVEGEGTGCIYITNALIDLHDDMSSGITLLGGKSKPKLKEIDKMLDLGFALIFRYYGSANHSGHYTLCIGRTKKYYTMVNNYANRKIVSRYTRKQLSLDLRRSKDQHSMISLPYMWVISRSLW